MPRVVHIDDQSIMLKLVNAYLKSAGFDIQGYTDQFEAIEALTQTPADLVLMDIDMPGMDGFEATSTLRDRGYDGKIVALTASRAAEDMDTVKDSGCDGVIAKPIPVNVTDKVKMMIAMSRDDLRKMSFS